MRMAGRLPEETDCALPLTGQVEKPRDKVMVIPVRIGFHAAGIEEMYSSEPNGFIVLEEGVENVPAGQPVRVLGTCWHRRP